MQRYCTYPGYIGEDISINCKESHSQSRAWVGNYNAFSCSLVSCHTELQYAGSQVHPDWDINNC